MLKLSSVIHGVHGIVFNRFLYKDFGFTSLCNFSYRLLFKAFLFILSNVTMINSAGEFVSRQNVPLYYDFKTLITDVHKNESVKKYAAQMLLYLYEMECIKEKQTHSPDEKRKPFIEIESNNATASSELVRKLAKRIGGVVIEDPAYCLYKLEEHFNQYHPLYGAYCSFSMYAVSYNVTLRWHDKPVVTSGFWLQKATYFISKEYENKKIPMYGSAVYDYPKDLIMPDIAFTVHYEQVPGASEESVKREHDIMNNIDGPPLFDLRSDLTLDEMIEVMAQEIIRGLRKHEDLDTDFKSSPERGLNPVC